ncbi:MAG: hypothetical protein Ta2B_25650 [Termitinemataceae bacterium]|nr:MAG: hypothetical protein Ta2B_25650 [Termitinemataceae bacterium]
MPQRCNIKAREAILDVSFKQFEVNKPITLRENKNPRRSAAGIFIGAHCLIIFYLPLFSSP